MKRYICLTFFSLLFFVFISGLSGIQAEEFQLMADKENVPVNKTWTIEFNVQLDSKTVTDQSIYVEDFSGGKVPLEISLNKGAKLVVVSPKEHYKADEQYTLYVTSQIKSITGKPIEEPVKMSFHTVVYKKASLSDGQELAIHEQEYATIEEAKKDLAAPFNVIVDGDGDVVWVKEGIVIAASSTTSFIYEDIELKNEITSVERGTELEFVDSNETSIQVQIAGRVGYVNKSSVEVVPQQNVVNQSYYRVEQGELHHVIFNNGKYESYVTGPAPSFMKENEVYYSWDGVTFAGGESYQYFNYMPLRIPTKYTAEDLNNYIKSNNPDSPLNGLGEFFIKAQDTYQVNALYLLSHAITESGWGKSKIAQEKYNLFGMKAVDEDAFKSAVTYGSFEESISDAANYVSNTYLNPDINKANGIYYGGFLGNKGLGMNVKYASDPYWGQKIAGHMYRIDRYLGSKEINAYDLVMNTEPLYARPEPHTKLASLYRYRHTGTPMAVINKVDGEGAIWYQIVPEYPYGDTTVFVHSGYVEGIPTP